MTGLRFAPDSSVLVPAAQAQHPNHALAVGELEARLDAGQRMLLAGHALIETYSVLTRLLPPFRMSPPAAHAVIRSFLDSGEVVSLTNDDYVALVGSAAVAGIAGGRIYDAVIAASARAANADVILTFNVRDFEGISAGMQVRRPGDSA
jgi:predicted nucleic acid-binding protein